MMKKFLIASAILAGLATSVAYGQCKHTHGEIDVNMVVDGQELIFEVISPLDNTVGFEYAPRNDAQKEQVRRMAEIMRGTQAFILDSKPVCTLKHVKLSSDVIDSSLLGEKNLAQRPLVSDHGNLEAVYTYHCEKPDQLDKVTFRLFDTFKNMRKVHLQALLPAGQRQAILTSNRATFSWK